MANEKLKYEAKRILWHEGQLSWKLDSTQKELYKLYYDSTFKVQTWLLSRRSGKCLKKGTEVMTPNGPKKIEDFKPGDMVYGYNYDGSVSLTPVLELIYSGTKNIKDYYNNTKLMASCTDEHPWMFYDYNNQPVEKRIGDVSLQTHKLMRKFVQVPMGNVKEPHAYAIGALLGDGCSKQNGKYARQIFISSENDIIPKEVSKILQCSFKKASKKNYTWCLTNNLETVKKGTISDQVDCNYYKEWIFNRYAHEKILDLDVIKTWDRESCLKLLAGLIDTDGSIRVFGNILTITFGCQSLSTVEVVKYLIKALFQYDVSISKDDRLKCKNGPVYSICLRNNLFSKIAVKELDPYLQVPRKKWKPEYENLLENNSNKDKVGVKSGEYYEADCYDLSIGNESHLYLLANGLVTHNTFALCVLALEQCLRKPNSIVKFVSPTKVQVNNNVRPLFKKLLEDCPEELVPTFKATDYIYYFPNGSEIQLAGTDSKHAEKLRGGDSHAAFVDEAGSCADLDNIVKSILLPTTLITKGKIILAGTPPADADHEFLGFIEEGEQRGSLIKKTVYDNPRITKEQLDELITELGGIDTDACKRELFCILIKDPNRSVVPEFTKELEQEIVQDWVKPPHYDPYVAMDIGLKDLTVLLFGYYDFKNDKIIIEDELVVDFKKPDIGIAYLIKEIKAKEKDLWFNPLTNEHTQRT